MPASDFNLPANPAVAQDDRPNERRRELRVSTDEPASIRLVDSWSSARADVRVLDKSERGLKLRGSSRLSRGILLDIHLKDRFAVAEVRHCHSVGDDYDIGVMFQDIFPI